jgi:hypothetical protein
VKHAEKSAKCSLIYWVYQIVNILILLFSSALVAVNFGRYYGHVEAHWKDGLSSLSPQ